MTAIIEFCSGRSSMLAPGRRYLSLCVLTVAALRAQQPATIHPSTIDLPFIHDLAWDATRSRIIVNDGSNIVVVNPETAQIEDTIASGVSGQKLAISDDGQYLYVAIGSRGVVDRYQIQSHLMDLEIPLGTNGQGDNLTASAMVVLPGQPQSILIARSYWSNLADDYFAVPSYDVAIYDGAVQRPTTVARNVSSLYVRRSDGSLNGWGGGYVYQFSATSSGVAISRTTPMPPGFSSQEYPAWNDSLLVDRSGNAFDLASGQLLGRAPIPSGCGLAPGPSGTILSAQGNFTIANPATTLVQYSANTFQPIASASISGAPDFAGGCDFVSVVWTWGTDGIAISSFQHSGGGSNLVLFHASGLTPVTLTPAPTPQIDPTGVIRLALPANDLVFDNTRNLLWATVPGGAGQVSDSLVSIDPASGNIVDTIFAGSEPSQAVISADGSQLLALSQVNSLVTTFDLNAKTRGPAFSVSDTSYWTPTSLAPLADSPSSVAVSRLPSTGSYEGSVVVYDNGVPRPLTIFNGNATSAVGDQTQFITAIFPGEGPDLFYGADLQLQSGGGAHDVFRLRASANGIAIDKRLNGLSLVGLQAERQLVNDSGSLFTSNGERWATDISQLLGSYGVSASYATLLGVPVPFGDLNRIVYMYSSGISQGVVLTEFEMDTMRPLATLQLSATASFPPGSQTAVGAGTSTVAVITGGQILLIPLASIPAWPALSPVLKTVAPGVQSMTFPVNGMAAIPGSSKLVFTTPSSAGPLGNSVITFDPTVSQIQSVVFAGSEPTALAMLPDGSAAYAKLTGENHLARVNLASNMRDLVFSPDPFNAGNQYAFFDMTSLADGGLAISYYGGGIAVFDGSVARPLVDANTQGPYAYLGGSFSIGANEAGDRLYAFDTTWSTEDMKRCFISSQGIQWLSSTAGFYLDTGFKVTQGLLYTDRGAVIDPERSRLVGNFATSGFYNVAQVVPDAALGRVFFTTGTQVLMFDINTRALLGSIQIPAGYQATPLNLVRYGADGLAFSNNQGQVFFVSISAIPLLATPVTSPQPALPATPGVTVVDLAVTDIAYDTSRNLIYASVPNSEAANGDQIASIDPGSGSVAATWYAGMNPKFLSITDDSSQLFFNSGWIATFAASGLSPTSETINSFNLATGVLGQSFPNIAAGANYSYGYVDLTTLPGQSQSVATIDDLYQGGVLSDGSTIFTNSGPDALTIYDNGTPRPNALGSHQFSCLWMLPDPSGSMFYCSSGSTLSRMTIDSNGIYPLDSFNLLPGLGTFGHMVFSGGRIYASTGLVIDPQAKRTITRVAGAQGPVAVDGNTIYWLDQSTWTAAQPSVSLRSFNATTFQPIAVRQIKTTATNAARLILCGQGRLAFGSGNQVYIVNP